MHDQNKTIFELWLDHQRETPEPQQSQVFYADADAAKGEVIGWRCLTCGKTAGQVPE